MKKVDKDCGTKKKLIKLHNNLKIYVKSEKNNGSTFTIKMIQSRTLRK